MKEKNDLLYLSNLPLHVDTWDADPDKRDAVAKHYSVHTFMGKVYNNRQLEEILKIIKKDETPTSFRKYGRTSKNPHELYMTSMKNNIERERKIYRRIYSPLTGNIYTGVLPENFEWLEPKETKKNI